MSAPKFIWHVNTNSGGESEIKERTVPFGDGYVQQSPHGINPERQNWSVVANGYTEEIEVIIAFLRERQGASFRWKPPLGVEGWYRCSKWKPMLQSANYYELQMEFEMRYIP